MIEPFAVLARHHLDVLLIQDNAIEVRIARLTRPIGLTIFLEYPVEEPGLVVSILDDLDSAKHDDARIHECRVAGKRCTGPIAAASIHMRGCDSMFRWKCPP